MTSDVLLGQIETQIVALRTRIEEEQKERAEEQRKLAIAADRGRKLAIAAEAERWGTKEAEYERRLAEAAAVEQELRDRLVTADREARQKWKATEKQREIAEEKYARLDQTVAEFEVQHAREIKRAEDEAAASALRANETQAKLATADARVKKLEGALAAAAREQEKAEVRHQLDLATQDEQHTSALNAAKKTKATAETRLKRFRDQREAEASAWEEERVRLHAAAADRTRLAQTVEDRTQELASMRDQHGQAQQALAQVAEARDRLAATLEKERRARQHAEQELVDERERSLRAQKIRL